MMHVLISEGLIDRDYISSYTLGFEALKARVLDQYTPAWAASVCGISVDEVVNLAREYGTLKPAAIRLNYGMQRHAGGGIAARTIACLPRSPARGAMPRAASSSRPPISTASTTRRSSVPISSPGAGRVINPPSLATRYRARKPPVRMTIVYNNNPVAVCPTRRKSSPGFRARTSSPW